VIDPAHPPQDKYTPDHPLIVTPASIKADFAEGILPGAEAMGIASLMVLPAMTSMATASQYSPTAAILEERPGRPMASGWRTITVTITTA